MKEKVLEKIEKVGGLCDQDSGPGPIESTAQTIKEVIGEAVNSDFQDSIPGAIEKTAQAIEEFVSPPESRDAIQLSGGAVGGLMEQPVPERPSGALSGIDSICDDFDKRFK